MVTAPGDGRRTTGATALGRLVLPALVGVLGLVLALAALDTLRRLDDLDARRGAALSETKDPTAPAGETADAFRLARTVLAPGARFALAFGPDVDRNARGFYRLFSTYYLYPAVAVAEPARAEVVLVFGSPPAGIRGSFEAIGEEGGVWLGRRRAA